MSFQNLSSLSIGKYIEKLIQPVLKKRGFAALNINTDWPWIIGKKWSEVTSPERLVFKPKQRQDGMLYLRTESSVAVLLHHVEPEIIERINTYFGYKAVAKIKILQGFAQVHEKPVKIKTSLSPESLKYFQYLLKDIDEGPLKEALIKLGSALKP